MGPNVKLTGRGPRKSENEKRPYGRAPVERNVRLHFKNSDPVIRAGDNKVIAGFRSSTQPR